MQDEIMIPTIKKNKIIKTESDKATNYFLGVEEKKENAVKRILEETKNHKSFNINYDFKNKTKLQKRRWSYEGNIMIYENFDANDRTRIIIDGTKKYECILWVQANK